MDGILIVDKPRGLTSHDVVAFVRKTFGLKKVGHAGTLDPMATGVLVILIGAHTKSAQAFLNDDKEYEGTMLLGGASDTGDAWGKITPSGKAADFDRAGLERVFKKFSGRIEQRPPMYSAVKYKGKKLYELARKGIVVQTKPRTVFINNLEITEVSLPRLSFKVSCSKGTYVRQLCVDIGEVLGSGAYLSALKRTRSGRFNIDQAISMDELRRLNSSELEKRLALRP